MKLDDKIFAVIDTNILVSSFFTKKGKSNPAIIIDKVVEGTIIPVVNQEILNEYKDVLTRSHFNFSLNSIWNLLDVFEQTGIMVENNL